MKLVIILLVLLICCPLYADVSYRKVSTDEYVREVKTDQDLNKRALETRKKSLEREKAQLTSSYTIQVTALNSEIRKIEDVLKQVQ